MQVVVRNFVLYVERMNRNMQWPQQPVWFNVFSITSNDLFRKLSFSPLNLESQ